MSRVGENIYQRKDGRWEGRYMKGRKKNGGIYYGYVYGKNREVVQERLRPLKQIYTEIMASQGSYAGTMQEWLAEWLCDEVKPVVKASTYATYTYKLREYVYGQIGGQPLNLLTEDILNDFVVHLQHERHLAPNTIKVIFFLLRRSLKRAVERGLITQNVAAGVTLPKVTPKNVHSLTKSQQRNLEKSALASEEGLATLLALRTGLRIGEIAGLKWSDIDMTERRIHVTRTYQRVSLPEKKGTQLMFGSPKTVTSQRSVPFSATVACWLKMQKGHQQDRGGDFVLGKTGQPIEPRQITNQFHKIVRAAGLSGIHFHQLRHTFATRCLEAKSDVSAVSALLGHASAKMTLDIYADSLFEQRMAVVEAMEMLV